MPHNVGGRFFIGGPVVAGMIPSAGIHPSKLAFHKATPKIAPARAAGTPSILRRTEPYSAPEAAL